MFTDLGKDWASGPPADYHRFIPMLYIVDVHMQNYEINTYVNDHNIIDKPLLRDENGQSFQAYSVAYDLPSISSAHDARAQPSYACIDAIHQVQTSQHSGLVFNNSARRSSEPYSPEMEHP